MITKKILENINLSLQNNTLPEEIHHYVNQAMNDSLNSLKEEFQTSLNKINYFLVGDYLLNTNLKTASPLTVFVSIKQNKEDRLIYNRYKKLKKTMKKVFNYDKLITHTKLSSSLYDSLINHLSVNDKIFINDNIIILKINNEIKVKIIVGYLFDDKFEYEYLGNYHNLDLVKLLDLYENKQKNTKHYSNVVKMLKSIELELINKNVTTTKLYDKIYFLEDLCYNIPNNLLQDNSFADSFINALNYLKNSNLSNFKTPDDKELFNKFSLVSLQEAKAFINSIVFFFKNFDKLY